ncbi:MAG: SemiSWEET family transporter [Rickettsia endosymbiont of Ixodes persulcatus]|nr:SemiSWEET family transporter [Rickettsia endosymbiont of Ixodes persulcatus]MCZ6903788.1 SemiSWEET family transporter [Rickettsia endosymbiont of Ixodes persulcatus]MCZ6909117.1 SemiSWEET family transporter [Rickettsia endosymbiont of Ixodes persulcatus]MCZ6911101.1 SemiSWEET family transporter [Rickettsia endosymbiont of Ixodes persulcatus]MCZ6914171.1 SemiSWEET family transporter [Rickettsia endosymbiont of Ixodes persulcatus]
MTTNNSDILNNQKSHISYYYEYYIMIVGILGQSMHYIQAYKIFSTQSAEDISMPAYLICLFLLISWLIYGIIKKAKALIYAEILGMVGCSTIIIGTYIYN